MNEVGKARISHTYQDISAGVPTRQPDRNRITFIITVAFHLFAGNTMLVLAHRGYHADIHENTMEAFEAAFRLGIDGIETDVRLSADGKPVIMHDRVTPAGRAVCALTHREIEGDVGHAVPLLAEILDAIPDVLWNIEIKVAEAWPVALRVLRQFQGSRKIFVSSFRHDVVFQCASELDADCGLLIANRPLDVAGVIAACAGRQRINSIVWDYNIVDETVLEKVTAGGWHNYVYGAVTPAEHAHCATLGLRGLITDYPQRAGRTP
jgi:glycerophosphoryl diester phosphodiesterase